MYIYNIYIYMNTYFDCIDIVRKVTSKFNRSYRSYSTVLYYIVLYNI